MFEIWMWRGSLFRTFHFVVFPSVTVADVGDDDREFGAWKTFVIGCCWREKVSPEDFPTAREEFPVDGCLLLISDQQQQQLLSTTYLGKCIRRLVDSLSFTSARFCRADRDSRFFDVSPLKIARDNREEMCWEAERDREFFSRRCLPSIVCFHTTTPLTASAIWLGSSLLFYLRCCAM